MKNPLFDYNYHLPFNQSGLDLQVPDNKDELEKCISQEIGISHLDWQSIIKRATTQAMKECEFGAHFMIMDQEFVKSPERVSQFRNKFSDDYLFTTLFDFRDLCWRSYLKAWVDARGVGIKFHPYLQNINTDDYDEVLKVCSQAEEAGLIINVDCSYGTKHLFERNGVKLIAEILKNVTKVPVIAVHFGGPMILEVCSLAHAARNLYIDLSLSLPYWMGSSVMEDLNFAISKLGSRRFLYGSDHPFISSHSSYAAFVQFCNKWDISGSDVDQILHGTAKKVLQK